MKYVKTFEEFISENRDIEGYDKDEFLKFLKKLKNNEIKISIPSPIRGGKAFDKMASQIMEIDDAIKAINKYSGHNGELRISIWNIDLNSSDDPKSDMKLKSSMLNKDKKYDIKDILKNSDRIKLLKTSFKYSDWDDDAHAQSVRSMM